MATIALSEKLEVLEKFECLMKESVEANSIYIRAKETILKYLDESNINGADKAAAVTSVLSSMASSITAASMQTALQWATTEKDLALRKLELSKQLDSIDADMLLKEAQKNKINEESIATQAETIRLMGTPTINPVLNKVISLNPEGKHWQDMQATIQQIENMVKEGDLLVAKLDESYAAVHKAVADAVTNFGSWKYSITDQGFAQVPMMVAPANVQPLSDVQRIIAKEQAKGYTYNAWANAVTSSAGMIGTMYASEQVPAGNLLDRWTNGIDKLNELVAPTI